MRKSATLNVIIDDEFRVVTESNQKIIKVIQLSANLVSLINEIIAKCNLSTYVLRNIRRYEFITDKQYKDLLTEMQNIGELPHPSLISEGDFFKKLKRHGHKISSTVEFPIIILSNYNTFMEKCPKEYDVYLEISELYTYLSENVIKRLFVDCGKLNKQQMIEMNRIYNIAKKYKKIYLKGDS